MAYLAAYPLCADCLPAVVLATEVHQVQKVAQHPDLRLVWANLLSLCRTCHARRTSAGQ